MGGITLEYHEFVSFLTIFLSLNEFSSIYREIKKLELQVCYSLAPKLCKNHNNVVYHDCTQLQRKSRKNAPLAMNGQTDNFGPVLKKSHKSRKHQKM